MSATDKFIQSLARRAGKVLMARFGKAHTIRAKEYPADVVTEADLAAEKLVIAAIKKNFPGHGIVSEESGNHNGTKEYMWYIDPLDGTFNFSRGTPIFCTMIGLARRGRPVLSAIFDPNLNRFYFAKRGKGAFLNGARIHCSAQKNWAYSYGLGPTHLRQPLTLAFFARLVKEARHTPFWLSAFGSLGISVGYLACGVRDWYATGSCNPWEAPTAALLLQEAGCTVTTRVGTPWNIRDRSLVAANKYLHPHLLRLVRGK